MSLVNLEQSILAEIDAAADEASLEAVRVSVLGKKGSISERMKGLGSMSPEERKDAGAALNVLKDKVADALSLRKASLQEAALEARYREQMELRLGLMRSDSEGVLMWFFSLRRFESRLRRS